MIESMFATSDEKDQLVQMISLSGSDWQLGAADNGTSFPADNLDWLPATVPGNVQSDLEAAHHLKPLWYGAGDSRLTQVMQQSWWYRKSFFVPERFADQRLTLAFDGVDFSCTVWLNGIEIGHHTGMFRPFTLDVSECVFVGKSNELMVRIDPVPPELIVYLEASDGAMSGGGAGYPTDLGPYFFVNGIDRMRQILKDLKSPTNFGWDWGVNVYTLGIWRDVRLEVTGHARIESTWVESKLSDNYSRAQLRFEINVDSTMSCAAALEFIVTGPGAEQIIRRDVSLSQGEQQVTASLILDEPELWWPNGHGRQPLYTLTVNLLHRESCRTIDKRTTRFGVREIAWKQVNGAPPDFINPYQLIVNGRPIRMMGSNIIPPDLLFGRMNKRGLRLIELARHAGLNMLRVWGGGALLTDEMYDLADEYGIMLSQEFPLANCTPESDPVFLDNLQQTIGAIVKRLRNHPCIIEWSGGNEMKWRQGEDHPALHVLEEVTAAMDSRIFRATCPIQGSRHSPWNYDPETHYRHYDNKALTDNIGDSPLMRYGEFGTAAPAHLETWLREIPPSARWPIDDNTNPILIRKNVVRAVFGDDFWLQKSNIERLFGPMDDLATLIAAGQFVAAHGLRYAVDALRRRGDRLGGLTSWDFNEPWPNGAGSYLVDYDGRPLMSFAFMSQAVSLVTLSLQYDSNLYEAATGFRAAVWLVSDAPEPAAALQWEWRATDHQGRQLAHNRGYSGVLPQQALAVDYIVLPPTGETAGIILLELRLRDDDDQILTERWEIVGIAGQDSPLQGMLPGATGDQAVGQTTIRAGTTIADNGNTLIINITNEGTMAALFVEAQPLIVYRTDLLVEDHYICIPPGESRTVTIRSSAHSSQAVALAQTGWRITAWNAPDEIIFPDRSILLAVGRQDGMCQEFMICEPTVDKLSISNPFRGKYPDAGDIPYLLSEGGTELLFLFDVQADLADHSADLYIHASDQAGSRITALAIRVNDHIFPAELKMGLGVQDTDPAHLAFPSTIKLELPAGTLNIGENSVEIAVNDGWFTLDAIRLVSTSGS